MDINIHVPIFPITLTLTLTPNPNPNPKRWSQSQSVLMQNGVHNHGRTTAWHYAAVATEDATVVRILHKLWYEVNRRKCENVKMKMSRNKLISDCTLGGVMQPMIDRSERKGGLVCEEDGQLDGPGKPAVRDDGRRGGNRPSSQLKIDRSK